MNIDILTDIIRNADSIVFFGGAGMSTESGIPDFRSENGLYMTAEGTKYSPETMLSHNFFVSHTDEFFQYYTTKMVCKEAKPNSGHIALAKLEEAGRLKAVVTQNIDGLHQLAGSKKVFELHGSVHRNYCTKCRSFYDLDYILNAKAIPRCAKCNSVVKPDVVLYEESLDNDVVNGAINSIRTADVLIIGGTSLVVYPAAGLIDYFRGKKLVLVNKSTTPYDSRADLVINDSVGKVLETAVKPIL